MPQNKKSIKRKVAFVGFGELGNQIFHFLAANKLIDNYICFDEVCFKKKEKFAYPFNDFLVASNKFQYYICLGYKNLEKKKQIIDKLISKKKKVCSFIHKSAVINKSALVGEGSFVYPMCNIDMDVVLGRGVILNNSVTISHNSKVGDCTYLSPGVVICGAVTVGCCTFIGAGSVISNKVSIGDNCIIGIGTVVTRDLPDNSFAIGNPMKILKKKINLI